MAVKETNNFANENNHAVEILENLELKENTIIIFDRKYYSKNLLKFLNNKKIIPIFRLDITNNFSKKLIDEKMNEIITEVNGIKFKVIKYSIEGSEEDFFIGTTKIDLTIEDIKELYWKRWKIEEFYKNLKHKMKGWFYNTTTKNNYLGSIKAQHFGYTYSRIMQIITEKFNILINKKRKLVAKNETKNERRINFKECMNISIDNILYDTLCNINGSNEIDLIFYFSRINNSKYTNVPDRKYKRFAIINKSRWNRSGHKKRFYRFLCMCA